MNFCDHWATDEHGEKFIFTVEMQRALSEAGLPVEPASLALLQDTPSGTQSESKPQSVPASVRQEIEGPPSIQIDPFTGKYIGQIKWYNARKKYGFIIRGGGEEIFFHESGATLSPEMLQEGAWILYDVEETFKGPEATDLEPYTGEPLM